MKRLFQLIISCSLAFWSMGNEWNVGISDFSCPDGWLNGYSSGCYKFLPTMADFTWPEAQRECDKIGGFLAEPKNQSLSEFVHALTQLEGSCSGRSHYWLGLSDQGHEGEWVWSHSLDMLNSSYYWGPDSPDTSGSNSRDCVSLVLGEGRFWWEDIDCSLDGVEYPITPLCQIEPGYFTTTTVPPTTTVKVCPGGSSEFENYCYLAVEEGLLAWNVSDAACSVYGGHLASVHSEVEMDFIKELLKQDTYYWLGATDGAVEGEWVWTDGSDFDYSDWYHPEGEENNKTNCLAHENELYVQWVSLPCAFKMPYVCKF